MHPSGQLPAYEFALGRRQPAGPRLGLLAGLQDDRTARARDRLFLARAFQKLLINFTWWVNRKDVTGKHLFAGGFLGLDNISLFDRSKPLPGGAVLEQADGTAWMAFYCVTMLAMALELAKEDPAYEDVASKFFEHFVAIADAMNRWAGPGCGTKRTASTTINSRSTGRPIRLRDSLAGGNHPAVGRGDPGQTRRSPGCPGSKNACSGFSTTAAIWPSRFPTWSRRAPAAQGRRLLAIPSRPRLERILRYVLDENEFLVSLRRPLAVARP